MKYDAFISYRHSELDMSIAKKIHKGLETFKVPKAVAKIGGKSSIKRVFRDQEELPIGSDLGDNITSALQESEYLVVICSPRTPQSYWVNKEISTFISMHGRDHVLAVLIEGEPDESFPKELLSDNEGNPVEPLAADVRGTTDKERNKKLKVEMLRLAAPILHCSYDDLRQRHRERRIKKIATMVSSIAAVAAVLGIGFGIYSAKTAAIIKENYNQKLINQSKYLAETSMKLLESGDREAAILVALEAVGDRDNKRPYVAEAEYALSSALYTYDLGTNVSMDSVFSHDLNVRQMDTDKESLYLTTVDDSDSVYLWDIASRKLLYKVQPSLDKDGIMMNVLWANVFNDRLVICDEEYVRSYSLEGELLTEEVLKNIVLYAFAKPNSENLYIWGNDIVLIYDLSQFKIVGSIAQEGSDVFGSDILVSSDAKTLWISTLDEAATKGKVLAYSIGSCQKSGEYITPYNYISDMVETAGGQLAIVSGPYKRGAMTLVENLLSLDVFDVNSNQNRFSTKVTGTGKADKAYVDVAARAYVDDESVEHNELMLLVGSDIYFWDAKSFKSYGELSFASNVSSLLLSGGSYIGYAGMSNGDIMFVDLSTPEILSDITISTDKNIEKMLIRGGIIFVESSRCCEVTLLTYHAGSSMTEVNAFDNISDYGRESFEGKYYAVTQNGDDGSLFVRRFESGNDKEAGCVAVSLTNNYVLEEYFISEDEFILLTADGNISYIDFAKNSFQNWSCDEIAGFDKYAVSSNGKYMAINKLTSITLIDVINRKALATYDVSNLVSAMAVTADGSKLALVDQSKGLSIIDVKTGCVSTEESGKCKMAVLTSNRNAIDISEDSKLLAMACSDDILRVIDLEKMNIVTQTNYVCRSYSFVKFIKGSDEIMLQGDNGVIKVFSTVKDELIFEDMKIYNYISDYTIDSDNGTLALYTAGGILLKDLTDYSTKSEINSAVLYLSSAKAVLVESKGKYYRFDLLSVEELAKSARQAVGRELTFSERVKYHID